MLPQEKFRKDKHIVFDHVLSPDMCTYLSNYMFLKKEAGYLSEPGEDEQCPKSWSIYGDPAFDTLLKQLCPQISNLLGLKLLPAYTYARIYQKGEELKWHKDRHSCEVSGTMTLATHSNVWPLYVGHESLRDQEKVGQPLFLNPGELVMYEGCDIPHWRDEFTEGEWQTQVFLHYVREDGPYAKECYLDGRPNLGIFKDSREYNNQIERIIKFATAKPKEQVQEVVDSNKFSFFEQQSSSDSSQNLKPFTFEV